MNLYEAVRRARVMLSDGAHSEYRRGVVNMLAEIFPLPFYPVQERMQYIEKLIGPSPVTVPQHSHGLAFWDHHHGNDNNYHEHKWEEISHDC